MKVLCNDSNSDDHSNPELNTHSNIESLLPPEQTKKEDKTAKKKFERIQVLNELIITEKEYHAEMKICYDTFMLDNVGGLKIALNLKIINILFFSVSIFT